MEVKEISYLLGNVPDSYDIRDYAYKAPKVSYKLSSKYTLRMAMPSVLDQGDLGSCVSNAIAVALKFIDKKSKKKERTWSRLFNYYNTRVLEGNVDEDSGCQIRNAIKVCNKSGSCFESTWPYTISKFKIKPSTQSYSEAIKHPITVYRRVNQARNDIKLCLSTANPIVVGFMCFPSIFSLSTTKTGNVKYPESYEQPIGGHCVLLVGYDDSKQVYEFMNSWSTYWGNGGFGTIPYKYIENPELAFDFWMIESVV